MVSQHIEKRYPWFRRWLYSVRFKIALVSVLVVGIALFGASRVLLTTLASQLHNSIINQTTPKSSGNAIEITLTTVITDWSTVAIDSKATTRYTEWYVLVTTR